MGGGRKPLGEASPTNPNWDPNAKDFAGNMGFFTQKDGKRTPLSKDDVYQLSSGEWVPLAGNDDVQSRIAQDKLDRAKATQSQVDETARQVTAQTDTALKQVTKKKLPKGGTILTSPLGTLGGIGSSSSGDTRSKTLIGA